MHPSVTAYHIVLRTTALAVALVLLFDSGLLSGVTKELSQSTQSYVANVISVGAAVEPTDLNMLTAEISKRNQELDAREAALAEREIAVGLNTASAGSSDMSTYLLSIVLFILTVLIVLNYALDFTRRPVIAKPRPAHE